MLTLQRSERSKSAPIEKARRLANDTVVSVTDSVRRSHLSPITGQELTYKEKEDQADAFILASPEPTEPGSEYGFIFGEVGITASTPMGVAQVIAYKAHIYRAYVGPGIERSRLLASKSIQDASTQDEIDAALNTCMAEMDQFRSML